MANAELWEQRVAAWRASGLTAAAYWAREGLGARALRQWTRRLRREGTPTVRLARVVAAPAPVAPAPLVIENEFSGHYWQNWTSEVRLQFANFMERSTGQTVSHHAGM